MYKFCRANSIKLIITMICAVAIGSALANDAKNEAAHDKDVIKPADQITYGEPVQAKFEEPADMDGARLSFATLRGELGKGSRSFLAKLTKGSDGNHTHDDAYEGIVLEGVMAHWTEGVSGSESIKLGPGSYWYQPAKINHREDCLSEQCVLFVVHFGTTVGGSGKR